MIEPIENGASEVALELTLSAIKEYLLMNGGKVKYADLYNRFRDLIIDSTTDDKFQEFVSNIAVKKYENESKDEWIVLKKKYMATNSHSPPHMGFFASTLQKTKHNLTKFSNKAFNSNSSNLGGKQTPPRSPLLLNNTTSSGSLSTSSVGNKQRSSSNSSSRRTSRNNSSAAGGADVIMTMPTTTTTTGGDSSSLSTSSLSSSLEQFHKPGHHSIERISVVRELGRAFTPPHTIFNHKSIDNLTMMDTSKLDKSTSRRSSSLILLDNTLVNTTSSSINNSTLVESPKVVTNHHHQEDEEKKTATTKASNRLDQSVVVDHSTNIKSVKEHAKKLNRLNTESELKHLNDMSNKLNKPSTSGDFNDSSSSSSSSSSTNKYTKIELDSVDISDPKPHEKEWIMACARGNYHDIVGILSKQPYLAQKKDPFNTSAHWACKHGNVEILKLLASTLENDTKTNPKSIRISHLVNSRTGYTCLHIAYICNHSELVPYLKTYGALPIVDYNGKYGIEYSHHNMVNNTIVNTNNANIDINDSNKIIGDSSLNDANTFIKRSSSTIIASKQKSAKDDKDMGFLSMKEGRNHRPKIHLTANMIESPFHRPNMTGSATKTVQSSPLNQRANETHSSQESILMPPPKSTVILPTQKGGAGDETNLTINEEETNESLRESKENLQFI